MGGNLKYFSKIIAAFAISCAASANAACDIQLQKIDPNQSTNKAGVPPVSLDGNTISVNGLTITINKDPITGNLSSILNESNIELTTATPLSVSEINQLRAKALVKPNAVNPTNSRKPSPLMASCGGDFGSSVDLGEFGIWIIGDYMDNPYFWSSVVFSSISQGYDRSIYCKDALDRCLASADRWALIAAATCGTFAGLAAKNIVAIAACVAGAYLWRDNAVNRCWEEYTRCMLSKATPWRRDPVFPTEQQFA